MADIWMPGATRYDIGNHGNCDSHYPPKAVAHITWDKNGTSSKPIDLVPYSNLVNYFTHGGKSVAPHILWDPFGGHFAQFFPANSRSLSLVDASGGTRTNRAGAVVIQIEALFFPYCRVDGKSYAKLIDTPCRGWENLQDWVHSWGVPNEWPMGMPDGRSERSEVVWEKHGGWYGHSQVPENSHTDPISWPHFVNVKVPITNSKPKTAPPFPGRQYFQLNSYNNYVTEVDKNLIRLKFTKHNDGNGYQAGPRYTAYTRDNVRDFQLSRGWSGSDANGFVGPQTWHDLFTV